MKILLTGATGQIGSALARALALAGHDLRCLVRPSSDRALLQGLPVTWAVGDMTDAASLAAAVADREAVVHSAGAISYWRARGARLEAVNVQGTAHLLDAAVKAGVRRFLLTSSIATIGTRDQGMADETTAYDWHGLGIDYFDTKRRAEELVLGEAGLEGLAVNPGIVFGPHDLHHNGARMLLQVARGDLFGVPPGTTTAAVLDDVVAGHLAALERGRPGERYILGGTVLDFLSLYRRIAALLDKPAPTRVLTPWQLRAAAGLMGLAARFTLREPMITPALVHITTRNRAYSSAKAIRELGYSPSTLETGLQGCWDWLRARGEMST
jgi:dihydroflavonol-4-reductase